MAAGENVMLGDLFKGYVRAWESWSRGATSLLGGAKVLEQWIIGSRNDARRKGVVEIPQIMRTQLNNHFEKELLDRVRYRVGKGPWLSLPRIVMTFSKNTDAITLDNVIVFRNNGVVNDRRLWIHECVHVVQYSRNSIHECARRYILNYEGLEGEADRFANQVMQTGTGMMKVGRWGSGGGGGGGSRPGGQHLK